MRILLVGDAGSSHLIKWVSSLHERGYTLGVFTNTPAHPSLAELSHVVLYQSSFNPAQKSPIQYLTYCLGTDELKKAIEQFQPHVVHAHYASSYGLLTARAKFHPYVLSVWGSDVYDFPNRNFLFRQILQYNLRKADVILSTSHDMADQTAKYTKKPIGVTPFGVNTGVFAPRDKPTSEHTTFGVIKSLESIYGIATLIEAFSMLIKKVEPHSISLRIVGAGSQESEYRNLVNKYDLEPFVCFVGRVEHQHIAQEHQKIDVLVNPSRSESFGVSVVESMACGNPVIVTQTGGLPEVIDHGSCGLIIPVDDAIALAEAMERLHRDKLLAKQLGTAGRMRAEKEYSWNENVTRMEKLAYLPFTKNT